jgi:hypothetical protein
MAWYSPEDFKGLREEKKIRKRQRCAINKVTTQIVLDDSRCLISWGNRGCQLRADRFFIILNV